jgi:hypothetical protein
MQPFLNAYTVLPILSSSPRTTVNSHKREKCSADHFGEREGGERGKERRWRRKA